LDVLVAVLVDSVEPPVSKTLMALGYWAAEKKNDSMEEQK
jgi:hypothetical protein